MSYSWQFFKFSIIFTVFFSNSNAWTTTGLYKQKVEEKTESLPQDFLFFVNHLDRMVYKREPWETTTLQTPKVIKAITDFSLRRQNNKIKPTNNTVFGDMLMMKLVSYYEKKYNVARGYGHYDKSVLPLETIATTRKYLQQPFSYPHWSQTQEETKYPADSRNSRHPGFHSFWSQSQEALKKIANEPTPDTQNANVFQEFQEHFVLQEPTEPAPEIVPEVMSLR